jgi:type II secretory pathway pseudopilin PulG
MYKAVILATALFVSLASASRHALQAKIDNRMALAMQSQDAIRRKHGLGKYAKKHLMQEDGTTTDAPSASFWDCARGFASGLQYSSNSQGACYIALDESINAASDVTSLLVKIYNPTVWAGIASVETNAINYIASVQSNCEFSTLLNTLTTSASTLVPQLIARVTGGMVSELPDYYYNMKTADSCHDVFYYGANMFSLVFNYYV